MLSRAQRRRRKKIRRYGMGGLLVLICSLGAWYGMESLAKEDKVILPINKQQTSLNLWLENRNEPQLTLHQMKIKILGKTNRAIVEESNSVEAASANSISGLITLNPEILILVNKDHMIPNNYEVDLTELNNKRSSVASTMYEALSEMLTEGTKEGLSFYIVSAYRSYEKQQQLIEEDVAKYMAQGMTYEEAYEETIKQTMPAGFSEHETGLAVDIVSAKNASLTAEQMETEENRWLQENCYKYGFIVRYPEGKSDITHIEYEPWHFRYVGKSVAKYIWEHNLTLEEFLEEIEE